MPFNKIAELGMEIGKAQLILESKDRQIEELNKQIEVLRQQLQQQSK